MENHQKTIKFKFVHITIEKIYSGIDTYARLKKLTEGRETKLNYLNQSNSGQKKNLDPYS